MNISDKSKEELWEMYQQFVIGEDGEPLEILIPNDIFEFINYLDIPGKHKAFAFLTWSFSKFTMKIKRPHQISMVKELWGYNSRNKSLDYLIKKDGFLDEVFLTETVVEGLDSHIRSSLNEESNKIQYKKPLYDVNTEQGKGKFFRVFAEPMLACMINNKELGINAFYVYCFICRKAQLQAINDMTVLYKMTSLSPNFIAMGSGLAESTVKKVLDKLDEYGLINRYKTPITVKSLYTMKDANKLLPYPKCNNPEKCFPTIEKHEELKIEASIPDVIHKQSKPTRKQKQSPTEPEIYPKPYKGTKDEQMKLENFMEIKRLEGALNSVGITPKQKEFYESQLMKLRQAN